MLLFVPNFVLLLFLVLFFLLRASFLALCCALFFSAAPAHHVAQGIVSFLQREAERGPRNTRAGHVFRSPWHDFSFAASAKFIRNSIRAALPCAQRGQPRHPRTSSSPRLRAIRTWPGELIRVCIVYSQSCGPFTDRSRASPRRHRRRRSDSSAAAAACA